MRPGWTIPVDLGFCMRVKGCQVQETDAFFQLIPRGEFVTKITGHFRPFFFEGQQPTRSFPISKPKEIAGEILELGIVHMDWGDLRGHDFGSIK